MQFTVLIVDDEAMPRNVLKDHLPWASLSVSQVHLASDGAEGIESARALCPDIIISDIKMPRLNGLEMAAAIREFLPECQFIFLSGYSDKEYLKGAIKVRAASYVEKPLDLEEITGALQDVISELKANAKPTEEELFFRGGHPGPRPMNRTVFSCEESVLNRLEKLIQANRGDEALAILNKMYAEISQSEGTSPEYLRQLYYRIIRFFLVAAETYNVREISEQKDYLLYTAVRQETLAGLWENLHRTAQDYFRALDSTYPDIAVQVENYLEAHFDDLDFTVQSMASDLGFTNTYLCSAYKKSTGKTINQRLTEIRLDRAKVLLTESDRKLYEIANAVGYGDGKYFVKLFTRELGLSPKEYRGRHNYEE